jgi:5-hydroxyisourate hydrolase
MTATISTHVLDTSRGKPAAGVRISFDKRDGATWSNVGTGETDTDGRVKNLVPAHHRIAPGVHRLTFDTGQYAKDTGGQTFFPEVSIVFEITDAGHYHVPLLLSPFGYSTYRGS